MTIDYLTRWNASALTDASNQKNNTIQDKQVKKAVLLKEVFFGFNGRDMPMSLRKAIEVNLSAQTRVKPTSLTEDAPWNPQGDNQSMRVKAFMAGTVGGAFTLTARVIRIVFKTAIAPLTVLYCWSYQSRYGLEGDMNNNSYSKQVWQHYKDEWSDLGYTLQAIGICWVQVFRPITFQEALNKTAITYLTRAERDARFDAYKQERIQARNQDLTAAKSMGN